MVASNNSATKTVTVVFVILMVVFVGCLLSGCLGGDDEQVESDLAGVSGVSSESGELRLPPEKPYVKSIDASKLRLGTASDAEITIFNNGDGAVTEERIIMTATAVKLDNWLANKALKTKSDADKTETYEMTFTETIECGESCTLCARFNLPAKVSGVSIAGIYSATIEVYADDTLIGTKNMDLHLQS
ncbi:MAG: hypothetical protein EF813_08975 [Methanosarcinales archaeon]|nr:MAG: hypothetical protein EF813_08975 [Methanosarcinales archaeon]